MLTDMPARPRTEACRCGGFKGVTVFNIAAPDDSLRAADCRSNVIHVAPSRAMLADALAQYLVWKKWTRWLLAYGSHPEDAKLADAYRRSAKRYGARIVQEREYKDTGGARQTDSGLVQTTAADAAIHPRRARIRRADSGGRERGVRRISSLPHLGRTPVAGSAGLVPVSWDPSSESWGGAQLQNRFIRLFHRRMTAARHAGMDGGTDDRRGGEPGGLGRSAGDHRVHEGTGVRRRCL